MPGRAREYSEEEVHAALELAASTSVASAGRHLGIGRATLYRWIDRYPKLWSDLIGGDYRHGRRKIAERLEVLADRYTAAEHDILDEIEGGKLKPKDAKEAAALIKAMGSSRGVAVAGVRSITGEADVSEVNINFPALEQAMERLLSGGPDRPLLVENEADALES